MPPDEPLTQVHAWAATRGYQLPPDVAVPGWVVARFPREQKRLGC